MPAFQKVFNDMECGLLVTVEHRIGAGEQAFGIGHRHYRFLGVHGRWQSGQGHGGQRQGEKAGGGQGMA